MSYALKGYKGKTLGSAVSSTKKLSISGSFNIQGRMIVKENDLTEKIYELFSLFPEIEEIAINMKDSGIVFHSPKG